MVVRYIGQVKRKDPLGQCFTQMVAWCRMAQMEDSPVVGLNLVQEEDDPVALNQFDDHMTMMDFLYERYPGMGITLHAGELAPGLVSPERLKDHIRRSINQGHASRIGHGADIMYEDNPLELLSEMRQNNILVEVCLSSNDLILDMRGEQHPLSIYLKAGVPVALATDDEGVTRSEITLEFVKAVREHGVDYLGLKRMARSSLEYAFVEGESLWKNRNGFDMAEPCADEPLDPESASEDCKQLIRRSVKARLQWNLETAFAAFERSINNQLDSDQAIQ